MRILPATAVPCAGGCTQCWLAKGEADARRLAGRAGGHRRDLCDRRPGPTRPGRRRLVIQRGSIYWVDLGPATGSRPAKRRPVLVVQAHPYNASRLATALVVVVTSNTALAAMPGNVFLPSAVTGLPR